MADEQKAPETKDVKKLGVFPQDKPINPDRLNDDLKAALGVKVLSVDTGQMRKKARVDADGKPALDDNGNPIIDLEGPFIYVTLSGEATEADTARVDQIVKEHNPDQLSARQQKEKDAIDAYARLGAADFAAIRKLEQPEQIAAILDLLEDWQRLMVAARG